MHLSKVLCFTSYSFPFVLTSTELPVSSKSLAQKNHTQLVFPKESNLQVQVCILPFTSSCKPEMSAWTSQILLPPLENGEITVSTLNKLSWELIGLTN